MEWRLRGKTQPPPCTSRHYSCFPLCPSILTHNPVPGTLDVQQPDQFPSYHCGPLLLRNQGSVTKERIVLGNFSNFIIKKKYVLKMNSVKDSEVKTHQKKIIESFFYHICSRKNVSHISWSQILQKFWRNSAAICSSEEITTGEIEK